MDHSLSLLSIGLQGIWYTVKAGQKLTIGHYWSGYCGTTHILTPPGEINSRILCFSSPLNISLHFSEKSFFYYHNHPHLQN
ncbi:hypothetical protein VIGAN_08106800 [Vigna angularis var. angularis]|uniref:Uncharacterized protein n=1 Tax=Vigna angularis var. angularis TaxID=157739 RepID=A0A0S3SNM8_PHAAN|nr:hypothetical protein VIGAN_08106800 [Vigna angularis var. angularis]